MTLFWLSAIVLGLSLAVTHDQGILTPSLLLDLTTEVHRSKGKLRHTSHSVVLNKVEMDPSKTREVLQRVKLRQQMSAALLEADGIVLSREVLAEKKLVTYFAHITINGQEFRVLLDTGSSEFWIPSSLCDTTRCKRHRRLDVASESFKEEQSGDDHSRQMMNLEYLSGKVEGPFVYATVSLGDVQVHHQILGAASTVSISLLDDVVWDGILGLAYPSSLLLETGVTPFFDSLIEQHLLTSQGLANQFSYYIDDRGGSLSLGGANCQLLQIYSSECADQFSFVSVTEQTYWTVSLSDVRAEYSDRTTRGLCPNGCTAIVDTGTYLIYGPANHFHKLGLQEGTDCADLSHLPTLHFDFRDETGNPITLSLPASAYVLQFSSRGHSDCVVGVSPDKDPIWTLGQVFLRSFYTVFDRDDNRIGFAPLSA